ncbi:MAG: aldo/keto reductase [Bacteroidota bacterium]|nr:aldo/keto reductase [Bacteroidota bacterium]
MKKDNRREFLKKSLLGLSGAALAPGIINGYPELLSSDLTVPELPVRTLGRTGIKTPLISMGGAEASTPSFVRAAYEAGIKLFFSATYYGEGKNEQLVGEGLKDLPRDTFVLGTAVPPDNFDNRTGKFKTAFDVDSYLRKAEGSLKRFGLDHVDIFLFPYAGKRETVMNEGVLKALQQLKKQGKTRFLGIASHSDTEEALNAAVDAGIYDIAMIAYNYKVPGKDSLNAAVTAAVKAGMGVVAMKTIAGAGRPTSPVNSDAILKWVLQNENITSIVSGMSSLEQMQKNLAMIRNLKMTEQEMKDLNLGLLDKENDLYCRQCRQCIPQCPHDIDIPTIMRSYMYAYGYSNIPQAWHTLADSGIRNNPCGNCPECSVKCTAGFDVRKKIYDISRLRSVPEDFLIV